MYTRHFGLTEKPFAIAPDPRYLYMSELHREALAHLTYGLTSDGCFILLTGEVGTGKTTVGRCLLGQLPTTTDFALIINPKLTARDLLQTICEELRIPVNHNFSSTKTYIDNLNEHLLRSHSQGRTTVLIIDEAQNLDLDVLEQLRLLTNLETNTQKLLKIILLGQPELNKILNSPGLAQVNQRITSRYHLPPLQPHDVHIYVQHRARVAGGRVSLFSDQAIKYLIKVTGGIPRLINILCDRALLGAYAENVDCADLRIMKKAGREVLASRVSTRCISFKRIVAATLLLLGILVIPTAVYYHLQPNSLSQLFPIQLNLMNKFPKSVSAGSTSLPTVTGQEQQNTKKATIVQAEKKE